MWIDTSYYDTVATISSSSQVLVEDQAGWVKKTNDRVYSILRETPPDGATFAATTEVRSKTYYPTEYWDYLLNLVKHSVHV